MDAGYAIRCYPECNMQETRAALISRECDGQSGGQGENTCGTRSFERNGILQFTVYIYNAVFNIYIYIVFFAAIWCFSLPSFVYQVFRGHVRNFHVNRLFATIPIENCFMFWFHPFPFFTPHVQQVWTMLHEFAFRCSDVFSLCPLCPG